MFVQLVDIVRARLADRGFTDVTVVDGIESRNDQTNFGDGGSANRVAFVPAADPLEILAPRFIGEGDDGEFGAKRQLFNVNFVFDVFFAGYVPTSERELDHRRRCFDLWEVVAQEVQRAYWGAHEWTGARWTDTRKQGRFGAELAATLVLNIPIFDTSLTIATPGPVPGLPKPVT